MVEPKQSSTEKIAEALKHWQDQNKHEKLFTQLEDFKRKLYPYA